MDPNKIDNDNDKRYVYLKGKYYEEFTNQYKIKDAGFVDWIVKFIVYTNIKIS